MRIYAQVVPRTSRKKVERKGEGEYKVWLTAPPVEGKANEQLVEVLSDHFGVTKSRVTIIGGRSARRKLIEIEGFHETER